MSNPPANSLTSLVFLGTATSHGVPMLGCACSVCQSSNPKDRRLRSSVYIRRGDTRIVIDCGPDFRQQLLRLGVWNLDAVLLTHEHNDHVAGMDDLRSIQQRQQRDFPIYLSEQTETSIRQRFAYAFDHRHRGVPHFELRRIAPGDHFSVKDLDMEVLAVDHGFVDILGFRIGDLVYITDAKRLPAETLRRIHSCSVLVINALRIKAHKTHLHLEEALDIIEQLNPSQAYLTHMSHEIGLHDELQKQLPDQVFLSYDGLRLKF